jgi:lysophospholipase L1-like esterase
MADAPRPCDPNLDLVRFKHSLPHLAAALKHERKIRIVAIGSSSTAGEGDIVPYPSRLELSLRGRFHHRMIDVLNRGISGQEAPSELSRFEPDVFDESPSLVIWQVGTNAVFRQKEFNFDDVAAAIVSGLDWLAGLEADVVLMDPQYTTAVVTPADQLTRAEDMVARISAAADNAGVNLLPRFALIPHWVRNDGIPLDDLVRLDDPDKLHMSDWATNCMSMALFQAIEQGVAGQGAT